MPIHRRALVSLTAVALAVTALAQLPSPPASALATARASATCRLSNHDQRGGLGPSYVTSLSVSGTSCSTGAAVVKAYYRCRVRSGGVKGRCHSSVLGFHCSEQRTGISVQFDGKVTCTSGHRRVYHTYVQDT